MTFLWFLGLKKVLHLMKDNKVYIAFNRGTMTYCMDRFQFFVKPVKDKKKKQSCQVSFEFPAQIPRGGGEDIQS